MSAPSSGGGQNPPNFGNMVRALEKYEMSPTEQAISKKAIRQLTYSSALGLVGGVGSAHFLSRARGFTGARRIGAYVAFTLFGSYTGTTIGLSFAVPTLRQLEKEPIWTVIMDALDAPPSQQLPGAVKPLGGLTGDSYAEGPGFPGSPRPLRGGITPYQFPLDTAQAQPAAQVKYNKYGDRIED